MTPETFESLLITEINGIGLPVREYPNDPKNYFPETDPGEVLVRYEGRKPIDRDITGQRSQVTYYAEIVVVSRQVRSDGGAYDWLQKVKDRLEGYWLTGMASSLRLGVESFMDEYDGTWQFGQKWEADAIEFQTWVDDNLTPQPPEGGDADL